MPISITDWANRSIIPTVQWPAILEMDQSRHFLVLDYLEQQGEWLSEQQIQQEQNQQLFLLCHHAKKNSPYYQKTLPVVETVEELSAIWQTIPIVNALLLQQEGNLFHSLPSPLAHGPNQAQRIRSHSGAQFMLLKNRATLFFDALLVMREHVWHKRNFYATYAELHDNSIDKTVFQHESNSVRTHLSWGYPMDSIVKTGQKTEFFSDDYSAILEWLVATKATYLNLNLDQCQKLTEQIRKQQTVKLNLEQLIVPAQGITQELRKQAQETIGAQLIGYYKIPELGLIAVQCPETANFHIQVENVLLEIVDGEGEYCSYGKQGRLIATNIHNFSSPLIRYDTGLHATMYTSCPCGRGAPLLII